MSTTRIYLVTDTETNKHRLIRAGNQAQAIRHAGQFPDLEDELVAFTTNGYSLGGSPNRADAWVWVLTELFPGLVKKQEEKKPATVNRVVNRGAGGWMGG